MRLMKLWLDEVRTLFTDNYYTNSEFAEDLLKRNTHLVDFVFIRMNIKQNPHGVTKAKIKRGDMNSL